MTTPSQLPEQDTGGTTAPRQRYRFVWLRRLIFLVAVVLVLYFARFSLLPPVGRFLDDSETPRRADCVLILGGGASTRPFVAAALIRSGLVRRALIPTESLSHEAADGIFPSEHELIRGVLLIRKVPASDIVELPGECDSTLDEAHALARFLDAEPETMVAVVTNDFHTRRARMLFRRVLGDRQNRVYFVSAPVDGVDANNWWRTEKGFVLYTNEYVKLMFYLFR